MTGKARWTPDEINATLRMRSEGRSTGQISRVLGRTKNSVALWLRWKRPEGYAATYVNPKLPPASVLLERDTRFSQPRTFEQVYLGDPLPGQSALDKRNREACHG